MGPHRPTLNAPVSQVGEESRLIELRPAEPGDSGGIYTASELADSGYRLFHDNKNDSSSNAPTATQAILLATRQGHYHCYLVKIIEEKV
jgi:hypothetical protein